jgi:2-iminobutanoate/2-iminopropanoate deaminase
MTVQKTPINPWTWQDQRGYSQAWKVEDGHTLIIVSGQASISADGQLVHDGDFSGQVRQTFENLRTVLEAAGASLERVVKLSVFLTDMSLLREYSRIKEEMMPGWRPASTVVGTTALAMPGLMVEIEAIAVL